MYGYVEDIENVNIEINSYIQFDSGKPYLKNWQKQKSGVGIVTDFIEKDKTFFTIEDVTDKIINFLEKEGD